MGQGYQLVKVPLPSLVYAAGGSSKIPLRDLPGMIGTQFAHLVGIQFEAELDPTYTAVPTVVGHNAVFSRIEFSDGQTLKFSGTGNDLRQFERLESGGHPYAETVTGNATTNLRYVNRMLWMGPPKFAGSPTDFAYPCAALGQGEVRVRWGVLTDISADTTAMTGTVRVTALVALMDEMRIPPMYERNVYTVTSDTTITGRGLYAFVAAANSSAYDALTPGDLSNITVDTGGATVVQGVAASALGRCYNAEFGRGSLDGVQGEPVDATYDVNNRMINLGTPTAAAAQAADLQPILWCGPEARITKIAARVDSAMRVRWSGTQTASGSILLVGRILEQPGSVIASIADRACRALNITQAKGLKLKLLSKADSYSGPHKAFLPWALKLK